MPCSLLKGRLFGNRVCQRINCGLLADCDGISRHLPPTEQYTGTTNGHTEQFVRQQKAKNQNRRYPTPVNPYN